LVTKKRDQRIPRQRLLLRRNDIVNANDSINKQTILDLQDAHSRRNDFGYTVGGPVKKDKIFFFWSQEWIGQITGVVRLAMVPTPNERLGDFSDQPRRLAGIVRIRNGNPVTIGLPARGGSRGPAERCRWCLYRQPQQSAWSDAGRVLKMSFQLPV